MDTGLESLHEDCISVQRDKYEPLPSDLHCTVFNTKSVLSILGRFKPAVRLPGPGFYLRHSGLAKGLGRIMRLPRAALFSISLSGKDNSIHLTL